jgi:hypothetical protein
MNQEMMQDDPEDLMFDDAAEDTADMVDLDEISPDWRCS